MTIGSFSKSLELLSPMLQLNERFGRLSSGEAITCEIMFHCTIRFSAGGLYHDIRQTANISKVSIYHVIWDTIAVINHCPTLDVELPTDIDELKAVAEGF
jgi:hypothetical protein